MQGTRDENEIEEILVQTETPVELELHVDAVNVGAVARALRLRLQNSSLYFINVLAHKGKLLFSTPGGKAGFSPIKFKGKDIVVSIPFFEEMEILIPTKDLV
jgi:hypothetical protein